FTRRPSPPSTLFPYTTLFRSHMNYSYTQLARIAPRSYRWQIWRARGNRLWKRYLRVAAALANVFGTVMIGLLYFVVLPPFAWLRSEEHTSELQSRGHLVCRLL